VAFLLATILVLAYLITRPHLGSVTLLYAYAVHNGVPDASPLYVADQYATRSDCEKRVSSDLAVAVHIKMFESCQTETHLLWGW
jgi:hypothetical protein